MPIFESGYVPKEILTYAADMIVYVGGIEGTFVALTGKEFSFADDVMSCTTELSTTNAPGTATIQIAVPRHSQKQYFKYGRCVFKPMQEIEIYFKGRFLDNNGRPMYYQSFWGVITDVAVNINAGQQTITLTCSDMLYWWEITRINTSPDASGTIWDKDLQVTTFQNILNHLTPHQMIIALARVIHGEMVPPSNFTNFGQGSSAFAQRAFAINLEASMDYWKRRQLALSNKLRIFGARGLQYRKDSRGNLVVDYDKGSVATLSALTPDQLELNTELLNKALSRQPNQKDKQVTDYRQLFARAETTSLSPFVLDDDIFSFFQPYNGASSVADATSGENLSRLELANQIREMIGYEFFMDVNGDLVFKPPFYNLDVREHDPVSIIRDLDILDASLGETCKDLVTRLEVTGAWSTYFASSDKNGIPFGSYVDYKLAREYGIRTEQVTRPYLNSPALCTLYAISELSRFNAKRYPGGLTIVGRPELHLGFPVYVESFDSFYYVGGLSHTYNPNGSLTTSINVEATRSKYVSSTFQEGRSGTEWDNYNPFRPTIRGIANVVLTTKVPDSIEDIKKSKYPNSAITEKALTSVQFTKDEAITPTFTVEQKAQLLSIKNNISIQQATQVVSIENLKPEVKQQLAKALGQAGIPNATIEGFLGSLAKNKQTQLFDKIATSVLSKGAKAADSLINLVKPKSTVLYKLFTADIVDSTDIAMNRVAEPVLGMKVQSYGEMVEIVQKGVYRADLTRIPVSDEFGYALIGGFPYGRGVKLDINGELKSYLPKADQLLVKEDAQKANAVTPSTQKDAAKLAAEKKKQEEAAKGKLAKPAPKPTSNKNQNVGDKQRPNSSTPVKPAKAADTKVGTPSTPPKITNTQDATATVTANTSNPVYNSVVNPAAYLLRITGQPDLAVYSDAQTYDPLARDYVTRYTKVGVDATGKPVNPLKYSGVGKYLTDFYDIQSVYDEDFTEYLKAETFGAAIVDSAVYSQKYDFNAAAYGVTGKPKSPFGLTDTDQFIRLANPDPTTQNQRINDEGGGTGVPEIISNTGSGSLGWPTSPKGKAGSRFGPRIHPIFGDTRPHTGVDFAYLGKVIAAESGTVTSSGSLGGYGQAVVIDHGNGLSTLYAHMKYGSLQVKSGQQVPRGRVLGTIGSTGYSTGIHLHFEVRINGTPVDPLRYIQ